MHQLSIQFSPDVETLLGRAGVIAGRCGETEVRFVHLLKGIIEALPESIQVQAELSSLQARAEMALQKPITRAKRTAAQSASKALKELIVNLVDEVSKGGRSYVNSDDFVNAVATSSNADHRELIENDGPRLVAAWVLAFTHRG